MKHSSRLKNFKYNGFTLIELLVVISIISLLSSVILASLSSARNKGTVAAGQVFDDNMYHAMGDTTVGLWNFDEGTGNSSRDLSGSGNDAQLNGGVGWSTNTPTGSGHSLLFNNSGQYVSIPNLKLKSPAITYSAWIYPTSITSNGYEEIVAKELQYKYRITFTGNTNVGKLGGLVSCDGGGWNNDGSVTGGNITVNKWYMVTMSADLINKKISIYINGTQVGQTTLTNCNNITYNNEPYYIGEYYAYSPEQFMGNIDTVRIYSSAVTASEVQKLYAEGLKTHEFAQK